MITWAYLAGFLDGDGWITMWKHGNCKTKGITVGFTQVIRRHNEMLMIWKFLSSKGIKSIIFTRDTVGSINKSVKMVNIHIKRQQDIILFLKKIIPFLLIKKQKAEGCYGYIKSRLAQRGVGIKLKITKTLDKTRN